MFALLLRADSNKSPVWANTTNMIPSDISEYNPNSINPKRVSNSPPAMAIAKPQTYPPIAPSNVLFGLIVGKNGVFPTAFPVTYDPVSLAQTTKDNSTI